MDEFNIGSFCPITNWEIIELTKQDYNIIYTIRNYRFSKRIWICTEYVEFFKTKREIFRWLLFRERIPTIRSQNDLLKPSSTLLTKDLFDNIISENYVPISPKEKFDQFLLDLIFLFPQYEGSIIDDQLLNFSFLKTKYELKIFIESYVSKDFIHLLDNAYSIKRKDQGTISHQKGNLEIKIKYEGLKYIADLEQNNKSSNRCFIAMSFSNEKLIKNIRKAIKEAINVSGYEAILIDEIFFESDKTINDAMIAEIRRSKFLVADFTEQKDGVYFEAGFALGLGLQVIYCCHESDFERSHFDLKHYPHIIYKDAEELKMSLINKIGAWID